MHSQSPESCSIIAAEARLDGRSSCTLSAVAYRIVKRHYSMSVSKSIYLYSKFPRIAEVIMSKMFLLAADRYLHMTLMSSFHFAPHFPTPALSAPHPMHPPFTSLDDRFFIFHVVFHRVALDTKCLTLQTASHRSDINAGAQERTAAAIGDKPQAYHQHQLTLANTGVLMKAGGRRVATTTSHASLLKCGLRTTQTCSSSSKG